MRQYHGVWRKRLESELAEAIKPVSPPQQRRDTAPCPATPPAPANDDFHLAKKLVTELIAQLSPEDRLVITLLHLEEKSVEEIRALTGWSRSAIKVRAFRARARMKKMLNERETFAFA